MRRFRSARAARWGALALLSVAVFEACSNSTTDVTPPAGPPIVAFASPSYEFGCDNVLVVHLDLKNITLRPPYFCGTTAQCGTMLVTLLETEDGPPLGPALGPPTTRAATADVQLDLSTLVNPTSADAPTLSQVHFVKAQLYGDSLLPFVIPAGGQGTASIPISLAPPPACPSLADAGAAGMASSEAGSGGADAGTGGAASDGGASASAGEAGFGG